MQLELHISEIVDDYKNKATERILKIKRIKKICHSHRERNLPSIRATVILVAIVIAMTCFFCALK
jgi:hypothetical protein